MNLFAKFIIYLYLIPNDIFKRGLISIEILPITTLLVVVKWETSFVPPSTEALIRTKTIVGITNEVDILGDRRAVDAHVSYFSALFTRVIPRSEKEGMKPPYVCPRCSNHTYSNNMITRFHVQ
jgi:hypothetical protein